jgi:hypothetical protein
MGRIFGAWAEGALGGLSFTTITRSRRPISLFGQFLVGIEHGPGYTDAALQPGFGVAYAIGPQVSLLGQIDFRFFPTDPAGETERQFIFGIAYQLGK